MTEQHTNIMVGVVAGVVAGTILYQGLKGSYLLLRWWGWL